MGGEKGGGGAAAAVALPAAKRHRTDALARMIRLRSLAAAALLRTPELARGAARTCGLVP